MHLSVCAIHGTPLMLPSLFAADLVMMMMDIALSIRFFPAFDQNRAGLYDLYDDNAVMSLCMNMARPPVPSGGNSRNANWDSYMRISRNIHRLVSPSK